MTLICVVAPQHTYRDWQTVVAKTVAKHAHIVQASNVETVSN